MKGCVIFFLDFRYNFSNIFNIISKSSATYGCCHPCLTYYLICPYSKHHAFLTFQMIFQLLCMCYCPLPSIQCRAVLTRCGVHYIPSEQLTYQQTKSENRHISCISLKVRDITLNIDKIYLQFLKLNINAWKTPSNIIRKMHKTQEREMKLKIIYMYNTQIYVLKAILT